MHGQLSAPVVNMGFQSDIQKDDFKSLYQNASDGMVELDPDIIFDATTGFDRYKCYTPVVKNKNLTCYKDWSYVHYISGIATSWNLPVWEHKLSWETDFPFKSYMHGRIQKIF